MKKKLILMGTNNWVISMFDRMANEHDILAVFTRPPAPAGRHMQLLKSPVHIWASARGVRVLTNISEYNFNPDFNIVASYGVILRDNVLSAAPTINLHPSLLPKYRGGSPMLTAILNGDIQTGVCLMDVTSKIDAGGIHMRRTIDIAQNDTIADLENTVADLSAEMLSEYLKNPDAYPSHPQNGEPTFCAKFKKSDMEIDWNKSPVEIHNQIRSIGGRTKIGDMDVRILETVISQDGKLQIVRILPAGKKPMDWKSFLNGNQWIKNTGFHNVAV